MPILRLFQLRKIGKAPTITQYWSVSARKGGLLAGAG